MIYCFATDIQIQIANNNSALNSCGGFLLKKQRLFGPDIVRVIAVCLVLTTHSLAYIKPFTRNVLSFKWTVYIIMRFTALSCVPLFILLTGFFMNTKKLSKSYYRGIIRVLISYVVISVLSIAADILIGERSFTVLGAIMSIFNFTANGYAWYVEMYIGLFLLIPFLNLVFSALSRKQKHILILSLAFLSFLPPAVKSFTISEIKLDIVPDYWEIIYPIAYYYIGAYISEYRPKLKKIISFLLVLAAIILPCSLCWIYSAKDGGVYAWYMMNGFGCLTTALIAVTIFLFLYDVDIRFRPATLVITEISLCSFEIYLFSYIIDKIIYERINLTLPLMVIISLALSYICAKVLNLLLKPILSRIDSYAQKKDSET